MKSSVKAVVDDINKHKLAWSVLCLAHGWMLGMILLTPMFSLTGAVCWVTEIALLLLTINSIVQSARRPGRVVHEWALEQQKHEQIKKLTGKTTEELEAMLQYHMEQGNIDEADKISQKLIASVDGTPFIDPVPAVDPGVVLKVTPASAGALPAWMTDEKEEAQQQSSNLPDWMRK